MEVTEEMRRAVKAEECAVRGHTYRVIETASHGDPVKILCDCGKSWTVVPGYGKWIPDPKQ